mmetsp:Transcript_3068/g.11791  ORF Transcript_3068/g.11791 Transcript_3068/m.11791 type:complete len:204 (-) Transcript_3068:1744-2355(-)
MPEHLPVAQSHVEARCQDTDNCFHTWLRIAPNGISCPSENRIANAHNEPHLCLEREHFHMDSRSVEHLECHKHDCVFHDDDSAEVFDCVSCVARLCCFRINCGPWIRNRTQKCGNDATKDRWRACWIMSTIFFRASTTTMHGASNTQHPCISEEQMYCINSHQHSARGHTSGTCASPRCLVIHTHCRDSILFLRVATMWICPK